MGPRKPFPDGINTNPSPAPVTFPIICSKDPADFSTSLIQKSNGAPTPNANGVNGGKNILIALLRKGTRRLGTPVEIGIAVTA